MRRRRDALAFFVGLLMAAAVHGGVFGYIWITRAQAATKPDPVAEKAKKEEVQGVFVVANGKAVFKKVETGITGATDIEVLNGLNESDTIITGSYQVIRTILNEAQVKVDNKAPVLPTKT